MPSGSTRPMNCDPRQYSISMYRISFTTSKSGFTCNEPPQVRYCLLLKFFEMLQMAQARRFSKEEDEALVAQVLLYDVNAPGHSWTKFTQMMADHPLGNRDPKTLNGRKWESPSW